MMTTTGGGGEVMSLESVFDETLFGTVFGINAGIMTNFVKGAFESTKGNRIAGGFRTVSKVAQHLNRYGLIAAATYCSVDFRLQYFGQKDDVLSNKIAVGAASAGLIAFGPPCFGIANRSAILYGAFWGKSVTYPNP